MDFKSNKIMKTKLLIVGFLLSLNAIAQCNYAEFSDAPKELFRKRVKEPGMRYGNPYTMFVRDENFNLQNTLQKVKDNINEGSPKTKPLDFQNEYGSLYYGILQSANEPEPAKCPELQEAEDCMHPAWVKNNAIIYLVGLKRS